MNTPEQGADTLVWLAETRPGVDWTPGEHYAKRRITSVGARGDDQASACGLWERSIALLDG